MEELVYTSARQGLQPGTSGFCTVEMTQGMSPDLSEALESISAYDHRPSNSVNWMFSRLRTGRGASHVCSRVGALAGEFSGRSNKLAHHLCLSDDELPAGGPMRLLGPEGPLQTDWSGEVRWLAPRTSLTPLQDSIGPTPCSTWDSVTGDAGMAGAVLERIRRAGDSPTWLVCTPAMDTLSMISEMLALLPEPNRWDITFTTYLHALPRSVDCKLRCVLPDSPATQRLNASGFDQWIDLRDGCESLIADANPQLVDAARRGIALPRQSERSTPKRTPVRGGEMPRRPGFEVAQREPASPQIDPSKHSSKPPAASKRWVLVGAAVCVVVLFVLVLMASSNAATFSSADDQRSGERLASAAHRGEGGDAR